MSDKDELDSRHWGKSPLYTWGSAAEHSTFTAGAVWRVISMQSTVNVQSIWVIYILFQNTVSVPNERVRGEASGEHRYENYMCTGILWFTRIYWSRIQNSWGQAVAGLIMCMIDTVDISDQHSCWNISSITTPPVQWLPALKYMPTLKCHVDWTPGAL